MTQKSKNIVLIIGFVLFLILSYRLAISKTLSLKNDYTNLKKEAVLFENTPKQLSLLKQKQNYYDSILNTHQIKGSSIQNNLLKTINSYADSTKLKVVSFLEPHVLRQNDLMRPLH